MRHTQSSDWGAFVSAVGQKIGNDAAGRLLVDAARVLKVWRLCDMCVE